MSNQIQWSFEGLPTVYTTAEPRLESTVILLKRLNKLHPEHKIQIISEDGNIEPTTNSTTSGDSGSNPKKQRRVSEPTEATEAVEETTELQPLLNNLGDTDTESDVL
jgi:hypothetical protein